MSWIENARTGFENIQTGQIPHYNERVPPGFAGWDVIPGDITIVEGGAYAGNKFMRSHTPVFSGDTMFALIQFLGWAVNIYDSPVPPPMLYEEIKATWRARLVTMPTGDEYYMFFWYSQGRRLDGSPRGYLWSGRMQLANRGGIGFNIDRMYINGSFRSAWASAPALGDGGWHLVEATHKSGIDGYYEYRLDGAQIYRITGDTTPFSLASEGVSVTYQPRGYEAGIWSRRTRDLTLDLDEVTASWIPVNGGIVRHSLTVGSNPQGIPFEIRRIG